MTTPNDSDKKHMKYDDIVNEPSVSRVRFKYLIHDTSRCIAEFFFGAHKEKDIEFNLIDQAKIILSSQGGTDKATIELCKDLIEMHRIHENTKSRKRLEIWATVVISIYLTLIVNLSKNLTKSFSKRELIYLKLVKLS